MPPKYTIPFYTIGLCHHIYACYYSKTQLDFSKSTKQEVLEMEEFSSRYLTTWNVIIQIIYMALALTHELLSLKKDKMSPDLLKRISKMRGFMYTTLVFPCTLVVALIFWSLYWINTEFVLPAGSDEVFPDWINHSIHTNIILLPLVELTLPKMHMPSNRSSFFSLTSFSLTYDAVYFFTYFEKGRWLYGLYYYLSWPERIIFILFTYVLTIACWQIGCLIQNMKPEKYEIKRKNYKSKVANVTKKLM